MMGLNFVGGSVLAIELLIVLTSRPGHWGSMVFLPVGIGAWPVVYAYPFGRWVFNRAYAAPVGGAWEWVRSRWQRFCCPPVLAFAVGIVIISIGPLVYQNKFNQYVDRVEHFGWMASGIQWVEGYNAGRQAIDLLKFTGTAYLYNWEWPRKFDRPRIDDQIDIEPRTLRLLKAAGIVIGSLLILGALPWPRRCAGRLRCDRSRRARGGDRRCGSPRGWLCPRTPAI